MKHGAEGTHYSCNLRLQPGCCYCIPHKGCQFYELEMVTTSTDGSPNTLVETARLNKLVREAAAGKKLREAFQRSDYPPSHPWSLVGKALAAYDEEVRPKE